MIWDFLEEQSYEVFKKTPSDFDDKLEAFLNIFEESEIKTIRIDSKAEGFLIAPKNRDKKTPLLVELHGGPFSSYLNNQYTLSRNFYLKENFSLLFVNFRGSTGYGRNFLKQLVGKAGLVDVEDCINVIHKTI